MANFLSKKASSLKSSWKKRFSKYQTEGATLPTFEEIKKWLFNHYPFICEYDQVPLKDEDAGFDHNVPISRGGSFGLDNIVICHKLHNSAKGELTGDEYKELLFLIRNWKDKGERFLSRLRQSNTIFNKRKKRKTK